MSTESSWNIEIKTPNGIDKPTFTFTVDGESLIGFAEGGDMLGGRVAITHGKAEAGGKHLSWRIVTTGEKPIRLDCIAKVEGDALIGLGKMGFMGKVKFTGTRVV